MDPWLLLSHWLPKCFAINLLSLVNSGIWQTEIISIDYFVLQAVMVYSKCPLFRKNGRGEAECVI